MVRAKTVIPGETLIRWRRAAGWDVPRLAREMRRAAGGESLPTHESLMRNIRNWERGHLQAEQYKLLYVRTVPGLTTQDLDHAAVRVLYKDRGEHAAAPEAPEPSAEEPPAGPAGDGRLDAAVADARRYLDRDAVGLLRRDLDRAKAEDGARGPGAALPLVLGIAGTIDRSAGEVRDDVRPALLSLGADAADFLGWLYRDLRDHGRAAWWYGQAMEWAQEAGDLPMQGYVLLRKSQHFYDLRDARRAAAFAVAADDGPWGLPPHLAAETAQQRALGMAMTGEPLHAVERQMDTASGILARAGDGAAAGVLELRQAACRTEAGQPARAAAMFGAVLASGTLSRRDAGMFGARRAVALAMSGEPDEAAAAGLEAAATAAETASARTARILGDALRVLDPWKARPGPRALGEAVTALETAPSR